MQRSTQKIVCLAVGVLVSVALGWMITLHLRSQPAADMPPDARAPENAAGSHDGGPSSEPMIASYLYGFQGNNGTTAKGQPANQKHPVGLLLNEKRAYQGYTLVAPLLSKNTYLIDMQGRVVHRWVSDCPPALSTCLLENGHLLRTGTLGRGTRQLGPGVGGRVQEFTWTGELVWDYRLSGGKYRPHHDIVRLPNGNVLMIVLEKKTADEAHAAGRTPELLQQGPWQPDGVLEIQPTGKTTGKVVWEWHAADHVIQDVDRSRPNYGSVADHPERIDVNYDEGPETALVAQKPPQQLKALRSLGYVSSGSSAQRPGHDPEWTHINSIAYNPDLDQILLSVRAFSEIWIIDHGTTPREAAGHTGGRRGKGGDLLYRWGNRAAHRTGSQSDRRLFAQHSAMWIAPGLPGQGHLLVFNNGMGRPDGRYSSVDEIAPPLQNDGSYDLSATKTFRPDRPVWSYTASNKADFYSDLLSGAQRLANGNTLICQGMSGTVFEVTAKQKIVWKYVCPPVRSAFSSSKAGHGKQTGKPAALSTSSPLFRAYRYARNYPGLAGKTLVPGRTIEEWER